MPLKRFVLITALAALVAACTSTTSTVTTQYYLVSGATSEAIDRDLRRKGPMRGHALAVAAIRFAPVSVRQEMNEQGCIFTDARFKVRANITLPRWKERSTTRDRQLRNAWDNLAAYARAHEDAHVKIAEHFAQELGNAIIDLQPRPTCQALDAAAERVVERMGNAHDNAQMAFDAAEQKRLERLLAQAQAGRN